MKITAEYLKKFCSSDDDWRLDVSAPFNRDHFTYATDGRIMIRVPKLEEAFEEASGATPISVEDVFSKGFRLSGDWQKLPSAIPEPLYKDCKDCGGSGVFTDLEPWLVNIPCENCDDGKTRVRIEVPIGKSLVDAFYLHLISDLPNVEISASSNPKAPLSIRFDGGAGVLMPLRPLAERINTTK